MSVTEGVKRHSLECQLEDLILDHPDTSTRDLAEMFIDRADSATIRERAIAEIARQVAKEKRAIEETNRTVTVARILAFYAEPRAFYTVEEAATAIAASEDDIWRNTDPAVLKESGGMIPRDYLEEVANCHIWKRSYVDEALRLMNLPDSHPATFRRLEEITIRVTRYEAIALRLHFETEEEMEKAMVPENLSYPFGARGEDEEKFPGVLVATWREPMSPLDRQEMTLCAAEARALLGPKVWTMNDDGTVTEVARDGCRL